MLNEDAFILYRNGETIIRNRSRVIPTHNHDGAYAPASLKDTKQDKLAFDETLHCDENNSLSVNTDIIATKEYVSTITSPNLIRKIVDVLPDNPEANIIYMVNQGSDIYEEHLLIDGKLQPIGTTEMILDGYAETVYVASEVQYLQDQLNELYNQFIEHVTTFVSISLLESDWSLVDTNGDGVDNDELYSQVVNINGIQPTSKVDLQPTVQQLLALQNEDAYLVAENAGGTVTVYAVGQKPKNDYIIQAAVTGIVIE